MTKNDNYTEKRVNFDVNKKITQNEQKCLIFIAVP